MNISSLLKVAFILLFPMHIMASTIPSYEVVETTFGTVDLTNLASFTINDVRNARQWNGGDQIELSHRDETFLMPVILKDGLPIVEPLFIITNSTQGKFVLGYLSTPPQQDLLTILSIDLAHGEVTLSDSSIWFIRQVDQRFVSTWQTGDIVLIGHNQGADSQYFDVFIFNATHSHIAHALQAVI